MTQDKRTPSPLPLCGENKVFPPERLGCAQPLPDLPNHETYRCLDCGVPFHRHCLRAHCAGSVDGLGSCSEANRLRAALIKINAIRNSIVGTQGFNFSEHAYPLVAALDEAGFVGKPYPEAKAYVGSLIDRAVKAEDELEEHRMADGKPLTSKSLAGLLARLDAAGGVGLDMSPGDPLAVEAAEAIRQLLIVRVEFK